MRGELLDQLAGSGGVAERADAARPADRNHVRTLALRTQLLDDLAHPRLFFRRDGQFRIGPGRNEVDAGAEQAVEEIVALARRIRFLAW